MPLKAAEIRGFQPIDTLYRKSDDKGFYLEIRPNGSKHWFLKYRIHGSEKRLSLGTWPEVSLADACERQDDARKKTREGDDPLHSRKMEKIRGRLSAGNSFHSVAEDLIAVRFVASKKAEATIEQARWQPFVWQQYDEAPEYLGLRRFPASPTPQDSGSEKMKPEPAAAAHFASHQAGDPDAAQPASAANMPPLP